MPLSNLPGPWHWEDRGGRWWRINDSLGIEDGPHPPPPDLMSRWYDRQGNPLDMYNAEELLGDRDYVIVQKDVFIMAEEPVEVSTVWLGLDHNWWPDRPIRIFETMIFGGQLHLDLRRYSTEEEARQGHDEVCKFVQLVCEASREEKHGEDPGG